MYYRIVRHHVCSLVLLFSYLFTDAWSFQFQLPRNSIARSQFVPSAAAASCIDEGLNPCPEETSSNDANAHVSSPLQKMIQWRGEKSHGNDLQFRQTEFTSALASIKQRNEEDEDDDVRIDFIPALSSNFSITQGLGVDDYQIHAYENAMQYITASETTDEDMNSASSLSNDDLIQTVRRCSLARSLYEIVAEGETYPELAKNAVASRNLNDLMKNGRNSDSTWAVRLRQYGGEAKPEKQMLYGRRIRSPMRLEREAVYEMGELLNEFTGDVDLIHADVTLYLFEGLARSSKNKVLARLLSRGAHTSSIAPKTRICVTSTPLCPVAAFTMCNVARIQPGDRILDPFAGSCAILLAASMIEPTVLSVGVEIALEEQVNRDDIISDFTSRKLVVPSAIIRGDSMSEDIRTQARAAVGNEPFDVIVTDPPYGIREKKEGLCCDPPLVSLVKCISQDRMDGNRLLKKGGRLVAFVPNQEGDDISLDMPSADDLAEAGLEFRQMLEQPINDSLSRWLVEYKAIE